MRAPLNPQNSQFKSQLVKIQNQNSVRNTISGGLFNHKESIEGNKAKTESKEFNVTDEGNPPLNSEEIVNDQLKTILLRTQIALASYKKRDTALVKKCKAQQEEILKLKALLL